MSLVPEEFKKIEKRDWHLWILVLLLFSILTVFVILVIFYSDISELYHQKINSYTFNLLFIGYLGLSLLFIAYIIFQELSLRKLRHSLIEEKISLSIVLGNRYQELKSLFEISTLVNSETQLSKIFEMVSSYALKCLDGDQSSLMLYDKKKGKLLCAAAHGKETEFVRNAEVGMGKSVCGWVVKHAQPLLLTPDNMKRYDFDDLIPKQREYVSALCVPLKVRGEVKGVLNVNKLGAGKKFQDDDLKFLSIFAQNASVAIEKAGLYEKNSEKMRALKLTLDDMRGTQSRLIQAEKFRALKDMASGINHDFNNIFAIILGRAELLERKIEDEKLLKFLKVIEEAAQDGVEKLQEIQAFHKKSPDEAFLEVDLNQIIKQTLDITKVKWKEEAESEGIKIDISTDLGEIPKVVGNPSELREALTSLILNACEALPQGGRISLKTEADDDSVKIYLKDTGIGMNREVLKKIFDPFFTTKTDKAAGLGLSVVYGIISRHNGEIKVESQKGKGTEFIIKLPASKRKVLEGVKK